jgi:3-hydroxybutyryl-CoA dehydrogenase
MVPVSIKMEGSHMNAKKIQRIAVIGPGMMGHCIAQEFGFAGYPVSLYGRDKGRLDEAMEKVHRNLGEMAEWGIIPEAEVNPTLGRISISTDLEEAVGDTDFVVEAVLEKLELKQEIFARLESICSPQTILASNTSSLMPSMIAEKLERPERFIIAHYFNPPYLMPLVEVVKGKKTSNETATATYELMKEIGKSPIMVKKEALGFIGNRLQMALIREAAYIVEQGIASPQDVDIACKDSFGRRLPVAGPFEYLEHNDGWDLVLQVEKYLRHDLDARAESSPLIIEKAEAGELGAKSGQGFYQWTPEFTENWRKRMMKNLIRLQKPLD